MTAQKSAPTDSQNECILCDKVGKLASDTTRRLYILKKQIEQQLIKLKDGTCRLTSQALKRGRGIMGNSTMICSTLEQKYALWGKEQELNKRLTQLGKETMRLHKEQGKDDSPQPRTMELVKETLEVEKEIQKIKDGLEKSCQSKKRTAKATIKQQNGLKKHEKD